MTDQTPASAMALVPVEPTKAMVTAGGLAILDGAGDPDVLAVVKQEARQCWSAMLAATPPAPAGRVEAERLREALQTCVDATHLYLQPAAMDGGIGECTAVLNARHAIGDARAALKEPS